MEKEFYIDLNKEQRQMLREIWTKRLALLPATKEWEREKIQNGLVALDELDAEEEEYRSSAT